MFIFFFTVFVLFSHISSFIHIQERQELNGFSTRKAENTPIFYNSEALYIVEIVWNTSD
jgi:hypothetical protein